MRTAAAARAAARAAACACTRPCELAAPSAPSASQLTAAVHERLWAGPSPGRVPAELPLEDLLPGVRKGAVTLGGMRRARGISGTAGGRVRLRPLLDSSVSLSVCRTQSAAVYCAARSQHSTQRAVIQVETRFRFTVL